MKPEAHTVKVKEVYDYYTREFVYEFTLHGFTHMMGQEEFEILYEEVNE